MSKLLLLSSSRVHGGGYLDHADAEIRDFLGNSQSVLFVPHALADHDGYAEVAKERFERMGYRFSSIHVAANVKQAVRDAEAVFIGGGNTFRLLRELYRNDLLEEIRQRVINGMLYMGASAGSNVAGPTIRTTNDMPIVQPRSFDALALVPFQINPHYVDADPKSTHMGETREQRLREYLEENETPVIAIREPAMLRVEDGAVQLKGEAGAVIFRRGKEPQPVAPGSRIEL